MANEKHQIDVELDEAVAQGTYANLAIISHSPTEFVLDFAAVLPGLPKAKVKAGSSSLRNTPNGCCSPCRRTSPATKPT